MSEPIDRRLHLRGVFDGVAERYDRCRPTYPDELYEELFRSAGLGADVRVAEIGCGTGQASLALASRAAELTCVELGEDLSAILREKLRPYPFAQVITSSFEEWESPEEGFNLLFAATCWHWMDPAVRYQKASDALKPGGYLAIVNSGHAFPEGFDTIFDEVQVYYDQIRDPGERKFPWPPPRPEEMTGNATEIAGTGLFEPAIERRFDWAIEYTAQEHLDLLSTYSDHLTMTESKREVLYEGIRDLIDARPGRRIRKDYYCVLTLAERTSP